MSKIESHFNHGSMLKALWCLAFLACMGLVLAGCDSQPDSAEETEISEEQDFPDTKVGRLLSKHMDAALGTGTDVEAQYQRSLTALRSQPDEVITLLGVTYNKIDESRYFRRWLMVETLRELHSDSALMLLSDIADQPIPDEKWTDDEAFSQDKEISIRTTAIAGIADLAGRGNEDANTRLTRFFKHRNPSIRRVAVIGYLGAGEDYETRVDFLKRALPEEDHQFITLKATNIKSVKHPDIPDVKLSVPEKDGAAPQIDKEGQ